jgi:hypothetical protein
MIVGREMIDAAIKYTRELTKTDELLADMPIVHATRTEHYDGTGEVEWVEIDHGTRGQRFVHAIGPHSAEKLHTGGEVIVRYYFGGTLRGAKGFGLKHGCHGRARNWAIDWTLGRI